MRATYDRIQHFVRKMAADPSLPAATRRMIQLHLSKPWVPGFFAVAIRPVERGLEEYLGFPIVRALGTDWYFPSRVWWLAHARTSHGPDGSGCNPDVHTRFLSAEGTDHEFDYANILRNGSLVILDRRAFEQECAYWQRAFKNRLA